MAASARRKYDPRKSVALICGYGDLPVEIGRHLESDGRAPFMVGVHGEADDAIRAHDHRFLHWGQIGVLLKELAKRDIHQVVFCGGIKSRPGLLKLGTDWWAIKSLPKVMAALVGGDNSVISATIKLFEDEGITVVGAHEIAPDLLTPTGHLAGPKPSKAAFVNIDLARRACMRLGELDAGQAAIVEARRVVAMEGAEGTDGMLNRIVELRKIGRMPSKGKQGVLVKMCKPNQDVRADLPTIGPGTIENVLRAGLTGIAVEAGRSFILHREKTLNLAVKHKLFVTGISA